MNIGQSLQLSFAPFDRPSCPECASPMSLVEVEPGGAGSNTRTYECPNCRFVERSVVRC